MKLFRIWLILLGISLIFLDKYTFISAIRDNVTAYVENHVSLVLYRVKSYTPLLILNVNQQQDLARQNTVLKKQVEEYSVLLQQSKNNIQDTENIQDINASVLHDNYTQIIAKSILDVNYFVNDRLLIEFNKSNNIKVGNAVVNKDGVVGQVAAINNKTAQVSLITNPDTKIYLQNKTNKTKVLAQGSGNNKVIVKYIDKKDGLQVGDILETTGLDDTYPANIPVVQVQKIFTENSGFDSAICTPIVDFSQLQYVSVLINDSK